VGARPKNVEDVRTRIEQKWVNQLIGIAHFNPSLQTPSINRGENNN
jgi:hypothetical protein